MLPGYGGHLVSASFLETQLAHSPGVEAVPVRQALVDHRRRSQLLGPASSVRTLFEAAAVPLMNLLGFGPPADIEIVDSACMSTARIGDTCLALVVSPWGERLDRFWRLAITYALERRAAWSLLFNGLQLRIVDATRPYSRRYIEIDLDTAADDDRAFAVLCYVARHLPGTLSAVVKRSDDHASDVCRSLRKGVLSASGDLLAAVVRPHRQPAINLDDSFEQALTIVYRILFLLFAEARGLVPLWHPVYRDGYSIDHLRTAAEQPDGAIGLWDALRAIAHLAHAGCRAGDLRVTPFNGRLFSPTRTPLAERRGLDDEAARRALLALSTRPAADRGGLERIAYRDLGVEQLGAVYETLLDYRPALVPRDKRPARSPCVALERGSGVRKATGTFYTPRPIADYLVRRTLRPLVEGASPERILQLRVLDPAMGSGAFLVAACRYLANAYETALVRDGGCHPTDIGEAERASIRRTIAERCLYGVDVNPMAVQLARLSLWLATLAADRPLTFLDHHLQTGDSLIGAWLMNLQQRPRVRKRTAHLDPVHSLFDEHDVREALQNAVPVRFSLELVADDTVEQVRNKERTLALLNRRETALSRWKRVADLWCAHWLTSDEQSIPAAVFDALSDEILSSAGTLPKALAQRYIAVSEGVATVRRPFHWELEFPEAFFAADGERRRDAGFDAVIGNPPWDMVRADTGSDESRRKTRDDIAAFVRFARDSSVYDVGSSGHANRYQLFVERAMALTREGGRIGLVLPSGLLTDYGSAALRRRLLARCDVDAIVGLDNRRGVFPIHRSVRFLLVTATAGSPTRSIACRLGEADPLALDGSGDEPASGSSWFPIRITPALIERLSGRELTIPDFRAPLDVTIAERAASCFAPLGSAAGWNVRFGRELNATDDRRHFDSPGSTTRTLPIVEGKHLEPFRVDLTLTERRHTINARKAAALLGPTWRARPRLAYRDVASATNRVTLIAAMLPAGCVSTHTVFCLRTPLPLVDQYFLCGLFNSLVVNYLVRMRVTTHVTTAVVERLPIPRRDDSPRRFRTIAACARVLARGFNRTAFARLQASVAELYQLSPDEFGHVLGTFPLIPQADRDSAFEEFQRNH